jgi:hypothetical protein
MTRRSFSISWACLAAVVLLLAPVESEAAGKRSRNSARVSAAKRRVERRQQNQNRRQRAASRAARREVSPPVGTSPSPVASPEPTPASASAPPPSRGPTRIDFDDRLVQGQTNRSGSVYLYDRKELKTASMLKMRDSFREEIVGAVYDR